MTTYQKLETIVSNLNNDIIIVKLTESMKNDTLGISAVLIGELENRLGEQESDEILNEIKKTI